MSRNEKFKAAPWINYAVFDIAHCPKKHPQLNGGAERAWQCCREHRKETDRFPRTADIARRMETENKSWVANLLMELVSDGYIASYSKKGKREWCSRKKAKQMLRADPSAARDKTSLDQAKK